MTLTLPDGITTSPTPKANGEALTADSNGHRQVTMNKDIVVRADVQIS